MGVGVLEFVTDGPGRRDLKISWPTWANVRQELPLAALVISGTMSRRIVLGRQTENKKPSRRISGI